MERLIEEDAGLLPGPLLVAPVRELRRHSGKTFAPVCELRSSSTGFRPSPAGLPDSDLSRCAPFSFRQYQAIVDDFRIEGAERSMSAPWSRCSGSARPVADLPPTSCPPASRFGYDPLITSSPEGVARSDDPAAAVSTATVVLALTTASTALSAAESALPGWPDAIYAD